MYLNYEYEARIAYVRALMSCGYTQGGTSCAHRRETGLDIDSKDGVVCSVSNHCCFGEGILISNDQNFCFKISSHLMGSIFFFSSFWL